jgi:Putative MetA-pathway of phenol degradation
LSGSSITDTPEVYFTAGGRTTMFKRLAFAALLWGSLATGQSSGQLCTTSHTTDLYCLLPAAFLTSPAAFNAFSTPLGTELSQLPTAVPAGVFFTFDQGVYKPSNDLGAVFSERAETIGKHRVFVGFTYQRFNFSSIDGNSLGNLPIILTAPVTTNGAPDVVYTVTTSRIDLKSNQYTLLGTLGLTGRLDVSVSIPIQRISMSAAVNGTEYEQLHGATASFFEYVPGSSSGIGDVILGVKGIVWQTKDSRFRVALGTDVRIPSGDELNFLGSGTIGIKPYVAASRRGKISPHGNLGYQWNGDSILNANSQLQKQRLPTDFFYMVGMDANLSKHVTLVADLFGKVYFNAPRLSNPVPFPVGHDSVVPLTVIPYTDTLVENSLGLGIKSQVFANFKKSQRLANLVVTGNVLLKLNNGGLRSTAVPLVGLSYSF